MRYRRLSPGRAIFHHGEGNELHSVNHRRDCILFIRLFFLLTVIPLLELCLLLWVHQVTNWQFTLLLVLSTGVLGAWLARQQGQAAWVRVQMELAAKRMPGDALMDALLILLAGVLLITPGLLTDTLGFSLLIPWSRTLYKRRLSAWFKQRFQVSGLSASASGSARGTHHDNILDVEVVRIQDAEKPSDAGK